VEPWANITASVVALGVVTASIAVVYRRMLPASVWARSALRSVACASVGMVVWATLGPLAASPVLGWLVLPVTGVAGLATFTATVAVRATGAGALTTLLFGGLWAALVFVPTALLTFGTEMPFGLQPVDHGGSLAINVATGAAALGVLISAGAKAPRLRAATLPLGTGIAAVVLLVAGWITWLVGAELAIDEVTPSIVLNGLIGAVGGAFGWLVVQRIRHQSSSLSAVAAGLLSGLVSITAGAPLFSPVFAAVAGILAGAAACFFTLERIGRSRRQQWFVVGSHLIAGAVGIVLLGLLATGMGFLFTGQISFFLEQALATLLVAVYSSGVSFALWQALRLLPTSVRVRQSETA
jgi:ammonia channel protein AmtB